MMARGAEPPGLRAPAGLTRNGLPYNRIGDGPRPVVVFAGLSFENKAVGALSARFMMGIYRPLLPECTVYLVNRRRGLPQGCTIADIAADYAEMIAQEFSGAVDIMGTSTGGSIALQFAADHGELARSLMIHSSAYKLGPAGKDAQLQLRDFARARKWRQANATLVRFVMRRRWYGAVISALVGSLRPLGAPDDPSDLVATIEAEDGFDLRDRLAEISVPTLVIAGAADPFYTEELFRETARGIPGAKLVLYPGMGHPAQGKPFGREVRKFLMGE